MPPEAIRAFGLVVIRRIQIVPGRQCLLIFRDFGLVVNERILIVPGNGLQENKVSLRASAHTGVVP